MSLWKLEIGLLAFLWISAFLDISDNASALRKNLGYATALYLISFFFFSNMFWLAYACYSSIGSSHPIQWNNVYLMIFLSFIWTDFLFYWLHRISHQIEFLWKFHSFHHEPWFMSIGVSFRHHIFTIVQNQIGIAAAAVLLNFDPWLILFNFALIGTFQHFVHTTRFRFPKFFEKLIVTPQTHVLHHDAQHLHFNYGGFFVFWDLIFRSFSCNTEAKLQFGFQKIQQKDASLS